MATRNVYLKQIPWEEALHKLQQKLHEDNYYEKNVTEKVAVSAAAGRITADAVYGKISSPHYRAAAMDGIAVSSSDTFGASETSPISLEANTQFVEIDTGDPLPDDKDAVIKIEDVHLTEDGKAEITAAAVPWQNVRPIGEDIVATEMLLPAYHKIRPYDVGVLLAGGITEVEVRKLPSVAILPTGTELVEPGDELVPGSIIEYNSRVMAAMVSEWGGASKRLPKTRDDYNELKLKIEEAVKWCDILVINAGSSAGREDYTASLIRELGELLVHGVAIKPGKPVALGVINGKPVIGIPGFPVSAALTFELFVKPLIYSFLNQPLPRREKVMCTLSRRIYSSLGSEEFVRVTVGEVGEKFVAAPLGRGAGVIMSLARAHGILRVPRLSEGFEAGEEVRVELLRPLEEVKNALHIVGSHDLSLDVLNDWMHRLFTGYEVSSAHVGSLGGLMALKRGEAHAAGVHLLDPETGEYNVSYVKKYLPGKRVKLVNLVYREQGFLVQKGNPLSIQSIDDLTRPEVTYINRQKGAGTRILLDYLLKKKGISPREITGYNREEFTHLNVGIAVKSGSASCGMGIKTAADALDLDFIPIAKERYDICIPEELFGTEKIERLLRIINNPGFKSELEKMGYDTSCLGEVIECD